MRKINTLKIYLLDNKREIVDEWDRYFKSAVNVTVVQDDFARFMDAHSEIECVVSPANSFGLMDGGYDWAITEYFGDELQKMVQRKILDELYGEQPVASSISVKIPGTDKMLIHTPTMRTPERIIDTRTVYHCTRTTLIEAMRIGVETIVLSAFGGSCGGVECEELARMMWGAYMQLSLPHKEIKWENMVDYTGKEMWRK